MSGAGNWRDELVPASSKETIIRDVLGYTGPKGSKEWNTLARRLQLIVTKQQTPKAGGKYSRVEQWARDRQRTRALVGKTLALAGTITVSSETSYRRASTVGPVTQRAVDRVPDLPWLAQIPNVDQRVWAAQFYDETGQSVFPDIGAEITVT